VGLVFNRCYKQGMNSNMENVLRGCANLHLDAALAKHRS
jgi:hypothetical protein